MPRLGAQQRRMLKSWAWIRISSIGLGSSLACCAQFAPVPNPLPTFGQFPQIPISTAAPAASGSSPVGIAAGRFNADSIPDLAVIDSLHNSVVLILSNGSSYNTPETVYTGTAGPVAIAVADFNQDTFSDIAIANTDGSVVVLLNNTQSPGQFSPISIPSVGQSLSAIATGNFNGDLYPDIAVADGQGNDVKVLLTTQANGAWTFQMAGGSLSTGSNPDALAVADFNGDGYVDIAAANKNINNSPTGNSISIFLGSRNGTFTAAAGSPVTTGVGMNPAALGVGDFNQDLIPDLAVVNEGSNTVSILLGNGLGGFTPASGGPITVGTGPSAVVVGEFNGALPLGIAVVNSGSNNVTVLTGSGTGTFTQGTKSPYALGNRPIGITLADLNSSGLPSLAVANSADGDIDALLNTSMATPTVISSASLVAGTVATGSIVSIFGSDSASVPSSASAAANSGTSFQPVLPSCLDGVSVTIQDSTGAYSSRIPLFYAGPFQINAQVPAGLASGPATFLVSTSSDPACAVPSTVAAQKSSPVTLAATAPYLFTANGTGKGVAAAQLVSDLALAPAIQTQVNNVFACPVQAQLACTAPNFIPAGLQVSSGTTALVLYGTGIRNRASLSAVSVTIAGTPFAPFYAGPVPGEIGEDQVNVSLPASLAGAGTVFVTVSIGSATSNAVTLCFENPPGLGLPSICAPPPGS